MIPQERIDALDTFTRHYLAAAFQLSDEEIGSDVETSELSDEAFDRIQEDCEIFQTDNAKTLARAYANIESSPAGPLQQWLAQGGTEYCDGQAGTDFWLTRNGHGSGYWDRAEIYGEAQATALDKACEAFSECDLYRGDDGLIYCSPA